MLRTVSAAAFCTALLAGPMAWAEQEEPAPEPAQESEPPAPVVPLPMADDQPDVDLLTPPGFLRDARGRLFQVTFDLRKRMYAGVAWRPTVSGPGSDDRELGRAAFDVGLFELEVNTGDRERSFRHRLHIGEGTVLLAPFGADITALRYDVSRKRPDPLFRLTTFFGPPRVYDVDPNVGGWIEIGHVTMDEVAPGRTETLLRFGTAHLTWDLLRTDDMESYFRLRSGLGLERAREDGRFDRDAVTWAAAAEGDWTLGKSGLNRLSGLAQVEVPTYLGRERGQPDRARRALTRLGFERVLVAINDQPITLRVGGEAEYRNDVPDRPEGWELRAMTGLRFNLWAPPR